MGAHLTKVAASAHVKAAASPVAHAQQHHERRRNHTNDVGPCQDSPTYAREKVISTPPCDDINLEFPVRTMTRSLRRYSEPAKPAAMATNLSAEGIRYLDSFESFLAERELMAIDMGYAALVSPSATAQLLVPPAPAPTEEEVEETELPEVQCVACCTKLPKEKDPLYAQEVIKPCRSCRSAYCTSCVRGMFLIASKDSTRMPPRCCMQIHLHHIKSQLSAEEIAEYKYKYEEWSTLKPFYCPVPTCSTFIPERLLPQQAGPKVKRKTDSGVGTPTSLAFECPQCEGEICVECRQVAHPHSLCPSLDFGLDPDTAALLKAWGYKRCPKCSQGLKRMYGCNHMECRCGAHFCWGCLRSRDDCEGGCYENEDEDEDGASDSEPDEHEPLPGSEEDVAAIVPITTTETTEALTQTVESHGVETVPPSQPVPRQRNLDGGAAHYWEQQDMDFGEEPTDDDQDRVWECHHEFGSYVIPLKEAISKHPSTLEMECVKCWCTILPDIETPPKPTTAPDSTKLAGIPARHGRGGRGRGRGNVARLRPAAYVPPRGLTRSDTTVGTAPHLAAQLSHATGPSPHMRADPMKGVQPGSDTSKGTTTASLTSNVFRDSSPIHNIARECETCSLLVCKHCADTLTTKQEAERAARIAELQAGEAALIAAAASTHAQDSTEARPNYGRHSPPSLFD